jgi:predicted lipid-binding transport protein (Tim44 family)
VVVQAPAAPPIVVAPPAASRQRAGRDWIAPVIGLLLGALVGGLFHEGIGGAREAIVLGAAGAAAATLLFLRRRSTDRQPVPAIRAPRVPDEPVSAIATDLDRGVSEIRRTDPGFGAAGFAGYAAMTFRDVQSAAAAGEVAGLRHRVTPAMYVELEARGQRLRSSGRSVHVAAVDVGAEVTEAWQESDRDYVTAYVGGSMLRHTIDGATGRIVEGSASNPVAVEAFLTFTRPAGLNFWMLSLIQGE